MEKQEEFMEKQKKRWTSTILAFVLMLGMTVQSSYGEGMTTLSTDNSFSVAAYMNNGGDFLVFDQDLKVSPGLAASYGYVYGTNVGKEDITALDVLIAMHEQVYADFSKATLDRYLKIESDDSINPHFGNPVMITKFFGHESSNHGLTINGEYPTSDFQVYGDYGGHSLSYTVNQAIVKEGDVVYFYRYVDDDNSLDHVRASMYYEGEYLSQIEVNVSDEVTLMLGTRYHSDPVANAALGILDEDGKIKPIKNILSNDIGRIKLTFDKTGKYKLVIASCPKYNLISDVLVVNVVGEASESIQPLEMPTEGVFSDVKSDDWFNDAVVFVATKKLFVGYPNGTFEPQEKMTRAQFVTVMQRIADEKAEAGANYSDVNEDAWFSNAALWGKTTGVTQVFGDTFNGNANITREEIIVMLYDYYNRKGDVTADENVLADFADKDNIDKANINAVAWAVETGFISGRNGTELAPKATATRAEVAITIMRLVNAMQQ